MLNSTSWGTRREYLNLVVHTQMILNISTLHFFGQTDTECQISVKSTILWSLSSLKMFHSLPPSSDWSPYLADFHLITPSPTVVLQFWIECEKGMSEWTKESRAGRFKGGERLGSIILHRKQQIDFRKAKGGFKRYSLTICIYKSENVPGDYKRS